MPVAVSTRASGCISPTSPPLFQQAEIYTQHCGIDAGSNDDW